MKRVWNETVSRDALFAAINRIRFSDKQQQTIDDLVENAFFYVDDEQDS